MTIEFEGLPRRRQGLTVHRHGPTAVLVDDDGVEQCVLNDTALALWELCDGETRPEEMARAVCEAFSVPQPVAEEDVERVLVRLSEAGLLDDIVAPAE